MSIYPVFVRAFEQLAGDASRFGIAVSGGSDSVALAALLHAYETRHRRLQVVVLHVDHGLRGDDADADVEFCRDFARRLDWPFRSEQVDTIGRSRQPGVSLESAARELRYECFQTWADAERLDAIVTAHHRDDHVESVLSNLIRGSGLRGLRGIPRARPLGGDRDTIVIRPLLEFSRRELADYRERLGLGCREDASNRDRRHRRNRIRLDLIPQLRDAFNPNVEGVIAGLADEARSWCAWRDRRNAEARLAGQCGPDAIRFDAARLSAIAPSEAATAGLFEQAWTQLSGRRHGLVRDHYVHWHGLICGTVKGRYELPDAIVMERSAKSLYLMRKQSLAPGASHPLNEGTLAIDWLPGSVLIVGDGGDSAVGIGDARFRFTIRHEERSTARFRATAAGDTMRTEFGTARIDEILRSRGIPQRYRRRYPVLEVGGEVVWLVGVRVATATPDRSATRERPVSRETVVVRPDFETQEAFVKFTRSE